MCTTTECNCKSVTLTVTPKVIQNTIVIQEYINAMRTPPRWSVTSGPYPDKAALLNDLLFKYGQNYNSN